MARKRGGIAGFYDRNKGVLQTLAPIAAGAIGGPLAGAAVGAAMRGFDRPGQSGIGLDLGQAAMGGITGYGAGKMGQALRGGVSGLFAPKATLPSVDMASKVGMTGPASLPPADMASNIGMTGAAAGPSTSTDYIGNAVNRFLAQGGTAAPSASPAALSFSPTTTLTETVQKTPSFFRSREGIAALGQGAQAAASLIGSQQQLGMEREQMERQQREAEERARLMALFAPSILASFNTPYGSQYTGMGGR